MKSFPEVTSALPFLSQISDECKGLLEMYMVVMYDRMCECFDVSEVRKLLFSKKGKSIVSITLTKSALIEHAYRVTYQAGHCWGQALILAAQRFVHVYVLRDCETFIQEVLL